MKVVSNNPYNPIGIILDHTYHNKRTMFVTDGWAKNWIAYEACKGSWVTLRHATKKELQFIGNHRGE